MLAILAASAVPGFGFRTRITDNPSHLGEEEAGTGGRSWRRIGECPGGPGPGPGNPAAAAAAPGLEALRPARWFRWIAGEWAPGHPDPEDGALGGAVAAGADGPEEARVVRWLRWIFEDAGAWRVSE